jgi:hypothetical protein
MTCNSPGYYTNACDEVLADHARHLIVHQYVACVKVKNEWAVPQSDELLWLDLPALVDVLIGSCLWNPDYGFFKITAYDRQAHKVQVQRKDVAGTASAGTVIPMCTKFIFVADHDL